MGAQQSVSSPAQLETAKVTPQESMLRDTIIYDRVKSQKQRLSSYAQSLDTDSALRLTIEHALKITNDYDFLQFIQMRPLLLKVSLDAEKDREREEYLRRVARSEQRDWELSELIPIQRMRLKAYADKLNDKNDRILQMTIHHALQMSDYDFQHFIYDRPLLLDIANRS